MKACFAILAVPVVACSGLHAQVAPAATGTPTNFSYVLRYAQTAQFGDMLGDWQSATPSGEVHYVNGSTRSPFRLQYAGGYTFSLTGHPYTEGWFQRLLLDQQLLGNHWKASINNNFGYLPQTPLTGFSGVPGTGEPVGIPTPPTQQSVLTINTHQLNNSTTGEFSYIVGPAYSISFGGNYYLLRFPDGNGLDTDTGSANAALTRRINARQSVSGEYVFSHSSYPDAGFTFLTNSAMGTYDRSWSRALHISAGAGPEWISSSMSPAIPSSIMLSIVAKLTYTLHRGSFSLDYNRGTAGGSGYMLGEKRDVISGSYNCEFARTIIFDVSGGYSQATPLSQRGEIKSGFGGVQASRRFGRHVSAFLNYTIVNQNADMIVPSNVVQHPLQTVSFGMTYTPRNPNRY